MANSQSETVNTAAQALEIELVGHHGGRYQDYLKARVKIATISGSASDGAFAAAMGEADDIFDDLMEGSADSIAAVMFKARTAHHWAMIRAQGSVMNSRIFADLFAIIAADLEILLAGSDDRKVVRP